MGTGVTSSILQVCLLAGDDVKQQMLIDEQTFWSRNNLGFALSFSLEKLNGRELGLISVY